MKFLKKWIHAAKRRQKKCLAQLLSTVCMRVSAWSPFLAWSREIIHYYLATTSPWYAPRITSFFFMFIVFRLHQVSATLDLRKLAATQTRSRKIDIKMRKKYDARSPKFIIFDFFLILLSHYEKKSELCERSDRATSPQI